MCASDISHTASVGLLRVCLPRQIVEVPIIDISLIKKKDYEVFYLFRIVEKLYCDRE